ETAADTPLILPAGAMLLPGGFILDSENDGGHALPSLVNHKIEADHSAYGRGPPAQTRYKKSGHKRVHDLFGSGRFLVDLKQRLDCGLVPLGSTNGLETRMD